MMHSSIPLAWLLPYENLPYIVFILFQIIVVPTLHVVPNRVFLFPYVHDQKTIDQQQQKDIYIYILVCL